MELHNYSHYTAALKILGLVNEGDDASRVCENKEIEQAYRRLARIHHPDRGGDKKKFLILAACKDFLLTGGAGDSECTFFPSSRTNGLHENTTTSERVVDHNRHRFDDRSSRVILHGRACVRDLATVYDDKTKFFVTIAATDEGLKTCSGSIKIKYEDQYKQAGLGSESVLCCALSSDGRFAFAGTGTGRGKIHRYILKEDLATLFDVGVESPTDNLIGCPLGKNQGLDGDAKNIVSIAVSNDICHGKTTHQIVAAACDSPQTVTLLRFKNSSVETLWTMTHGMGLRTWINCIDTLFLSESRTRHIHANENEQCDREGDNTFQLWVGGTNTISEAILLKWDICVGCTQDIFGNESNDEEVDCWSEFSDTGSDTSHEISGSTDAKIPTAIHNLGFGDVYSLDVSENLRVLAAAVGSDVIVFEPRNYSERGNLPEHDHDKIESLQVKKTLTTNHVLYCVKILSRSLYVAACGAGESVVIWSLVRGTVEYNLGLESIRHCSLATNCMMSLNWIDEEGTSIVAGGYDGKVTQWIIDCNKCASTEKCEQRFGRKDAPISGSD